MEDGAGSSDAPDPDFSDPPRAGGFMEMGMGRSSPVYRLGTALCRFVLGPVSLVRLRGDFRSTVSGRRAIPAQLALANRTTPQVLSNISSSQGGVESLHSLQSRKRQADRVIRDGSFPFECFINSLNVTHRKPATLARNNTLGGCESRIKSTRPAKPCCEPQVRDKDKEPVIADPKPSLVYAE